MAQQGQPKGIGVSVAQVIAGALASVSAAVVASFFGVAGTLIGAATTSVVATVGGALYRSSLERTQAQVVRIRRNPDTGKVTREVEEPTMPARRGRIRWGAVLGGLAVVLALTFGAVTAVEVLAQKPLAAVVQQEPPTEGQTTIGAVVEQVADTAAPASTEPTAPIVGTAEVTQEAEATATTPPKVTRTPPAVRKTTEPQPSRQGTPTGP